MSAADLATFRELLAAQLGWTFDHNDTAQLAKVLAKRAETHELSRDAYLSRIAANGWYTELTKLAEELTNNETYFYRHGEQFRALADVVLPERIRARSAQRVLRMLSVGCSSGEEAYTLAIVARELLPGRDWVVSVLGLDVSPAMLRRAATAHYSAWSLRETPDTVRQRWFRSHDGYYELDPAIRSAVRFREYNVAGDDAHLWAAGQYDVVFCRNLLMYLALGVRAALIRRMTRSLAAGGYLFLGHTDSLGSSPEGLEPQHTNQTFYYRRTAAAAPRREVPAVVPRPVAEPASPEPGPTGRYERVLGLLRDERFTAALEVIEAGRPDEPTPRELLLHGVVLGHTGRLEEAETVCRRLLDLDALYPDAHHQLAVCLEGGTAVTAAIEHYRLAAYLDPEFAMPRLRLGLLARRRGESRTAAAELDRALALLRQERDDRIVLFGGGFGRIALTTLCRAELDTCAVRR